MDREKVIPSDGGQPTLLNSDNQLLLRGLDVNLLNKVRQELAEAQQRENRTERLQFASLHNARAQQLCDQALKFTSPFGCKSIQVHINSANIPQNSAELSDGRLFFHFSLENEVSPQTIVKGRFLNGQKHNKGVLTSEVLRYVVQSAVTNPLPMVEQGDQSIHEKEESADDMFSDAGSYDGKEIIAHAIREKELIIRDSSESSIRFDDVERAKNVERLIKLGARRLEEDEKRELEEEELKKKLLQETRQPINGENPFSLKNASLIPLANQPARLHHITKGYLATQLNQALPQHEADEFDADYEYGIEFEGTEAPSSNYQEGYKPKRRRKDVRHDVDEIMKRAEKLNGV